MEIQRTTTEIGTPIDAVPTPALIIDIERMEQNIDRFHRLISERGGRLRSHIKTHKVPAIAHAQLRAGSCGIAAAKPSEAQVFHDTGITDIVIAFPSVGPDKWQQIATMALTAKVTTNLDSEHQARGLSGAAQALGATVRVQVEIDSGFHRVGIPIDDTEQVADFIRVISRLPGLDFEGITTFRGRIASHMAEMLPEEAGREEGSLMVALAERLRASGIPVGSVTAGGTLTGPGAASVDGITEVRAGTYVFYDEMSVNAGVARREQVAGTVLATVVSRRRDGWATIDAGTKTFSGDRGMVGAASDGSSVAHAVGLDAAVAWTTEEHGMVRLGAGTSVEVGQRIAFVPYHICTAVNLCDELLGVRDGIVQEVWPVRARGRRT